MAIRSILLSLLAPLFVFGQDHISKDSLTILITTNSQQANVYWQQGKIKEAVNIFESLITLPGIKDYGQVYSNLFYNLACGYSLLDNKEKSLYYLNGAVQSGYSDYEGILKDEDLKNIRLDERFRKIIEPLKISNFKWESSVLSSKYHPDLSEDEKVAGLSKVWSETKNSFAYFDHVEMLDWDSLYLAYLPEVRKATNIKDYYLILQKMAAQLHDAHTRIEVPKELIDQLYAHPPIQTRLIEDKVLIVKVLNDSLEKSGISVGQEIVSIDGIPVHDYFKLNIEPYLSSSTKPSLEAFAYEFNLLCGSKNSLVELELRNKDGHLFKRKLARNYFSFQFNNDIKYYPINKQIAYISVNTFGDKSIIPKFDSLFSFIQQSEAVILDLRDNPGGNTDIAYNILGYFVDKPFKIIQGKSRNYNAFDRAMKRTQHWGENPQIELPNRKNYYSKPVVVLLSAKTGSSAEEFCVVLKSLNRAKFIGTSSAGSTGQPLFYGLPGGGTGVVCTTRSYTPDGKEFIGIGLEPDIIVSQSISDFQKGNDSALNAAIDYLKISGTQTEK